MKVIIGGACQGKLAFAKREYQAADGWVDGQVCKLEEIEVCRGIYHFHEYVRRLMDDRKEGLWFSADQSILGIEQHAERFADLLYEKNPDILIVSNELGCGIVPMEKRDRLWREACGRVCIALAARADEVVRVVCGVGQKLTVQEEAPELVQNKIGKLSSGMMENDGVNDLPASACFPLFLDLSHTHLLVVGAGQIALRRIRALLGFAGQITVVAPDAAPGLSDILTETVETETEKAWEERRFCEPDPEKETEKIWNQSGLGEPDTRRKSEDVWAQRGLGDSDTRRKSEDVWDQSGSGEPDVRKRTKVVWEQRKFYESDLDGKMMVLAATDDKALNAEIAKACRRRGILVNVCSDAALCDFQFPSIVREGDLVVGVNASGRNHRLVKETRKKIEACLGIDETGSRYC